ncbi:PREDICTED: probable V-type proton ATPase subunit G [Rhagoletis zephyria]|uniref:probable V-type proton ATPase subunit G n=1 Tax=Rhagoletis zephyria TaxID=28612 RepID=UPI00081169E0|nr:PREDICTED: probable V-type proton ATPase subunit G [Rhagoletis zephyria]
MKVQQTPLPQLIDAEKHAADIIAEARRRRLALLKKAKHAASKELQELHKEREEILAELSEKVHVATDMVRIRVERNTEDKITDLAEHVAKNREQVINMIMKLAVDIKPEVHRNFELPKSRMR